MAGFLSAIISLYERFIRARTFVFIAIPALVAAIAGMCLLEVNCLQLLFASSHDLTRFVLLFLAVVFMLLILSFALSLLCLQLTAAAQAAGLAETAVLLLFAAAYTSVARQSLIHPMLYLVTGKILVTVLLARFWHAKFREFRMRFRERPTTRFFLERRNRFLSCLWVVFGSWSVTLLAFALALAESQTLLQLQGWEGLSLLGTFFGLFWIFVRNPHSHPEFFDEA